MAKHILTAGMTPSNLKKQLEAKTIATLSASIAHELKNNLSAIHIYAELAEINLVTIKKSVRAADYLITNLLLQIRGIVAGEPSKQDFKLYSITKNIDEALEQYPFQSDERDLIRVEVAKDFKYVGNPSLTNHILYNLLRNCRSLMCLKWLSFAIHRQPW